MPWHMVHLNNNDICYIRTMFLRIQSIIMQPLFKWNVCVIVIAETQKSTLLAVGTLLQRS